MSGEILRLPGPIELHLIDQFRAEVQFWMLWDAEERTEEDRILDEVFPEERFPRFALPRRDEFLRRSLGDGSSTTVYDAITAERVRMWGDEADAEPFRSLVALASPALETTRGADGFSLGELFLLPGLSTFDRAVFEHAVVHVLADSAAIRSRVLAAEVAVTLTLDGWCEVHAFNPGDSFVDGLGDRWPALPDARLAGRPVTSRSVGRSLRWYDLATCGGAVTPTAAQRAVWVAALRSAIVGRSAQFPPKSDDGVEFRFRPGPRMCGTMLLQQREARAERTAHGVFDDVDGVFGYVRNVLD